MLTFPNITVFCKVLRLYEKPSIFKWIYMSFAIHLNTPMITDTIQISLSHILASFSRNSD